MGGMYINGLRLAPFTGKAPAGAPTVVVDLGHGRRPSGPGSLDTGAVFEGHREIDFIEGPALRFAKALQDRGVNVVLTRGDNLYSIGDQLRSRATVASALEAPVFVSFHADLSGKENDYVMMVGHPGSRRGGVNEHSTALHDSMLTSLRTLHTDAEGNQTLEVIDYKKAAIVTNPRNHADGTAAVLVELGPIQLEESRARMLDPKKQQQLADTLATTVVSHLEDRGITWDRSKPGTVMQHEARDKDGQLAKGDDRSALRVAGVDGKGNVVDPAYASTLRRFTEVMKVGSLLAAHGVSPEKCEFNMSPEAAVSLQTSLRDAKFNPGPIDGDPGQRTCEATRDFVKANPGALAAAQMARLAGTVMRELEIPTPPPALASREEGADKPLHVTGR